MCLRQKCLTLRLHFFGKNRLELVDLIYSAQYKQFIGGRQDNILRGIDDIRPVSFSQPDNICTGTISYIQFLYHPSIETGG